MSETPLLVQSFARQSMCWIAFFSPGTNAGLMRSWEKLISQCTLVIVVVVGNLKAKPVSKTCHIIMSITVRSRFRYGRNPSCFFPFLPASLSRIPCPSINFLFQPLTQQQQPPQHVYVCFMSYARESFIPSVLSTSSPAEAPVTPSSNTSGKISP